MCLAGRKYSTGGAEIFLDEIKQSVWRGQGLLDTKIMVKDGQYD